MTRKEINEIRDALLERLSDSYWNIGSLGRLRDASIALYYLSIIGEAPLEGMASSQLPPPLFETEEGK